MRRPALDAESVFLAIVFIACCLSTIAWTFYDETPPAWDPSDHIRWSYDYYANLAEWKPGAFAVDLFSTKHPYPPLIHLGTALLFLVLAPGRISAILLNCVMLALLLISVRAIGRMLYPAAGLRVGKIRLSAGGVAAVVAAGYHFTAWLMHDAFLDFPLTALVAAGFALLIRAGDFRVRSRAVAFGVIAGLGMLAKQPFAFFFFLPCLHILFQTIRSKRQAALINLGLALLAALAVAAIWYVPHFADVVEIYRINRLNASVENEPSVFSPQSLLYYWYALIVMQMQIPLGVAFAVGAAWSLRRRAAGTGVLHLWLLSGILTFTLIANKDVRYTSPVLPAAALLSVSWIGSSAWREGLQRALVLVLLLLSIVGFVNAQWPGDWSVLPNHYFDFDHRPLPSDWGVQQALTAIAAEVREVRPMVGVAVNLPHLNPSSVAAYARLLAPSVIDSPIANVDWLTSAAALERIPDCDYLLARTQSENARDVSAIEQRAIAWLQSNSEVFRLVATFDLPTGYGKVGLYQRR